MPQHPIFSLASDNYSGAHPVVIQAITDANQGHAPAYGADTYSDTLNQIIGEHFGAQAKAFCVFNGTGANVLGLASLLPRTGAVLCAQSAHIVCDESNAPEYVAGIKAVTIASTDGKIHATQIASMLKQGEHHPQINAVYISQTTELGTCYSLDELQKLRAVCDQFGLYLYIDGARLCNAMAHLKCDLGEIGKYADILSLGGTKNGLVLGECLVVVNPLFSTQMPYLRKIHLQTGSKMRFISAQFIAWLTSGLYKTLAQHSNELAQYLANRLQDLPSIEICQKVQANAVFVKMPKDIAKDLQAKYRFYDWDDGVVRLMTSFDMTTTMIDEFIDALQSALANKSSDNNSDNK